MATRWKIAILGAGLGGLGMAARLKMAGEDSFVVLEKADRVGGTWRDNTYPGCACDVPSHLYWYSFDRPQNWSRVYPPQAEILRNIESFVSRRRLDSHIRCNTEVTAAEWDDRDGVWRIETACGESLSARSFIAASGQLNRPRLPDIEGAERYQGTGFHSAQWRHDVPLAGERVACIGSAASAVQIIPEIAPKAGRLMVFQRSANYVMPRNDREYPPRQRGGAGVDLEALRKTRETLYRDHEKRHDALRLGSATAERYTLMARAHLEAQVPDPVLRERLWPDYPLGCKRILLSDDFYPAFSRPNVELITDEIAAIEPHGVRTADGRLHEAGVILYATGFEATSFLHSVEVTGRGGRSLRCEWQDGAFAYRGMTVPGFPNFFLLYGPNTNLAHNSIIAMLECQFGYVMDGIQLLEEGKLHSLEVRAEAMRRFESELRQKLSKTAWAAACGNWYKTAAGRQTNNWPGTVEDYKAATARFAAADYHLKPVELSGDANPRRDESEC